MRPKTSSPNKTPPSNSSEPNQKNGISRFIEKSPAIALAAAVTAASSVVYTVTNQALKLEFEDKYRVLQRGYDEKYRILNEERSRINFAVKDDSSFFNIASASVPDEVLFDDYRRFRGSFKHCRQQLVMARDE